MNQFNSEALPDLVNAVNALKGLLVLVASRPDISDDVRAALTGGHRIEEANAALAKARGEVIQ